MRNVAIVDDCADEARQLACLLNGVDRTLDVRCFTSTLEFATALEGGYEPSALFIDVRLGERDADPTGIDMVAELYASGARLPVVYMSGYDSYHTSVYRTSHEGYLRKPFQIDEVSETWERVAASIRARDDAPVRRDDAPVTFHVGSEEYVVRPADIWYLESNLHRVRIHLRREAFEVYGKLSDVLQDLPPHIARCHQSFAVNLGYVERLGTSDVQLTDGRNVPVSRRYRPRVREALFSFIKSGAE